jgi:hypothetical protein
MTNLDFSLLSVVYVNCTLKKSPENSHTGSLIEVSKEIMSKEKVRIDEIRLIDHQLAIGVYPDMTKHD